MDEDITKHPMWDKVPEYWRAYLLQWVQNGRGFAAWMYLDALLIRPPFAVLPFKPVYPVDEGIGELAPGELDALTGRIEDWLNGEKPKD